MTEKTLFDNTEVAFSLKSDTELTHAYYLFKLISIRPLVKIGTLLTNFAIKAHLPVERLIRSTVFDHFCGGVDEVDCLPAIDQLFTKSVHTTLDYSVEGKENDAEFDKTMRKIQRLITFSKDRESMPLAVFKPTGFGRKALYEKVGNNTPLTTAETEEWKYIERRFDTVCKTAQQHDVPVLIDAEESWIQDAIDSLVHQMMGKYNTTKAIVFNTLQMYRHDRMAFLKKAHETARGNYFLGFKIVRGAYMEKERERADEQHYESPICKDKTTTDQNFDAATDYILQHLKTISLFAGTHNEASSYRIISKMKEHKIPKNDPRIWFAQLYGMSDHISLNLSQAGYNVAKYMPYGPVREVMPYLIRRAKENTSVEGQTGRELSLLLKERRRRKKHS